MKRVAMNRKSMTVHQCLGTVVVAGMLLHPALAATITVNSAATGSVAGACTLQDAVKAANTNAAVQGCVAGSVGVDTIRFASGINSITLTAPMLAPVASYPPPKQYLAGLVITEDLIIDGQAVAGSGIPAVTIQRDPAAQPFTVIYAEGSGPTLNVTLSGLTVSNGNPVYIFNPTTVSNVGGGAFAFYNPDFANPTRNKLTVRDCVFTGNTAGFGVYVPGTIDMLYSTISNNSPAGGLFAGAGDIGYSTFSNNTSSSESAGGGLTTGGTLRVDHSTISGNTGRYGGGFNGGSGGQQTFTNSVISGNVAVAFGANNTFAPAGGGLYSLGQLVLTDSSVSNNQANAAPNAPGPYSTGGGIYSGDTGNLTMTRTTVTGNQSGHVGGGVFAAAAVISASSIQLNGSKAGGGIYSTGRLQLDSSTVSGNTASGGNPAALPSSGGGIYANSALLTNVTISGNTAARGAGLAIDYQLDAIYVTVTANSGSTCAGLCPSEHYPNDTFSYNLANSVVAGNSGGGTDIYGNSAVTGNNSWIGTTSNSVTVANGTTIASCPTLGLAALANNGGFSATHALQPGSCLIGAGTPTSPTTTAFNGPISAVTTDQRGTGFPRIVGSRSDIGAFEYQHAAVQSCTAATRAIPDSGAFIRYLQGVTGSALMAGLYPAAEVSDAAADAKIADFTANSDAYDFNGDGVLDPLVDGLLYARYAQGDRGAALVAGLNVGAVRTPPQIESALAACH